MNVDNYALWTKPFVIYKTGASTGAGATTVWYSAPTRKTVLILHLIGYHTAGANRTCQWFYADPDYASGVTLGESLSLATATGWPITVTTLTGPTIIKLPIPVTGNRYLGFRWTASGAGENGYIQGIGVELPTGGGY